MWGWSVHAVLAAALLIQSYRAERWRRRCVEYEQAIDELIAGLEEMNRFATKQEAILRHSLPSVRGSRAAADSTLNEID